MALEIKLDEQQVAEEISKTIFSSTFKALFDKAVEEEIKKLTASSNWGSTNNAIIANVVQSYMADTMRTLLRTEYEAVIKEAIIKKISEIKLDFLVGEFVDRLKLDRY